MEVLYFIIILIIVFVIWYISIINKLNRTIVKIDEADSGIDIALTKRYDVLIKMMDVVKAYTKHEKETLFEVIKLRQNMTLDEKKAVNHKMSNNFDKIQIIAENYPELKSSENYQTLQKSIIEVEEHLQAARRMYNANVSIYNQMIVSFPTSIVANSKSMKKKDFFEVEEIKKSDVKIEL